jgi:deoxyribodipyrimidine photolyase-related protein
MPGYAQNNRLEAAEPLPWFYWSGETRMACMREVLGHTYDHAYSHHIQRLMVTGNFALIAGLDPHAVHEWYLAVYADAFEWVEMPNTLGLSLYADGGLMASKPYAASGAYIRRMSNFCDGCAYDPKTAVGEGACPFNALYWDFVARNRNKLSATGRMTYVYASWDRMDAERRQALRTQAQTTLARMRAGEL